MQYDIGKRQNRNIAIKKDITTFKGKDGKINIQIFKVLLNEPNLTYVEVTNRLLKLDDEWIKSDNKTRYHTKQKMVNRIYRRCVALKNLDFLEKTEKNPAKYSLSWKGYIALGFITKELRDTILKDKRFNSFLIQPRPAPPGISFMENVQLTSKEKDTLNDVYNILLPFSRPFFWNIVGNGLLTDEIHFDVIKSKDLGSWLWDKLIPYFLIPRQLQTTKTDFLPNSVRKKILKDKNTRRALEKLRRLMKKVVVSYFETPLEVSNGSENI